MYILAALLFFVFGTIIGSFLNVVIYRYNTGVDIGGRSGCMVCGKTLRWYELFPIISFIFLRGRCSGCKSPISWQYPLVELATGLLFLATFTHFGGEAFLAGQQLIDVAYYLFIFCLLVVITVYDMRHTIIPDGFVYTFILVSLAKVLWTYGYSAFHLPYLLDLLAGPILFLPFFLFWLVSRGRWMGFGDAKLALGIGWSLGLLGGISAIVFAFWIGAVWSVLYLLVGKLQLSLRLKHLTIKSEVPFAPFLILGMLLVTFFNIYLPGLSVLFSFYGLY